MSQDRTLLIATRNPGKVQELREMLASAGIGVVGLDSFPEVTEVEETGSTFEENARLKAVGYALQTGTARTRGRFRTRGVCSRRAAGRPLGKVRR